MLGFVDIAKDLGSVAARESLHLGQGETCKLGEVAFRVRRNLCPKKTPILRDEVLLLKKPSSYDVWILREFKERR